MTDPPCICGRELGSEDVPFWVQCDKCQRWLHGPCTHFANKQEAEESDDYRCPPCQQSRRATLVAVDKRALRIVPAASSPVPSPLLHRPMPNAAKASSPRPSPRWSPTPTPTNAVPPAPVAKLAQPPQLKIKLAKLVANSPVPSKPPSPQISTQPAMPLRHPSPNVVPMRQVAKSPPPRPSHPSPRPITLKPVPLTAIKVESVPSPQNLPAMSPPPRAVCTTSSPARSPLVPGSPARSPKPNATRSPGTKQRSPAALRNDMREVKLEAKAILGHSNGIVPCPIPPELSANGVAPVSAAKQPAAQLNSLAPSTTNGSLSTSSSALAASTSTPVSNGPSISPVWKKQKLLDGSSSSSTTPLRDTDRLDDSEWLELFLTDNHALRPLWVTPLKNDTHRIILETFNPYYPQAQHFMVTIAEPVSRTVHIHEWELTADSLYAAVSFGITSDSIVNRLAALSKVELHPDTIRFIERNTQNFGKAILVLENRTHYVEGKDQVIIDFLHRDRKVREAIRREPDGSVTPIVSTALNTDGGSTERVFRFPLVSDDPSQKAGVHSKAREELKRRCRELGLPLSMFYDFRNDRENPTIDISLKPTTRLRPYQEMALTKMFTNGRSRSGIIVLPCGAGKTLVGVTATTTIKRRTLVLCLNTVSVEQWVHQFKMWSTIEAHRITKFTAEHKETPGDVLVTTFNMLSFSGERASRSEEVMEEVKNIEWGLVILDEVHVVPAETFRKVIEIVHAHCILGLTATLLREDEKIDDLKFLIGPKLYEANWLELSRQGSLATVQCVEVHCPMTKEFYEEYLNADPSRKTQLYIMNPVKFWCTQALIEYHERCGDKIIVFSDSVPALHEYARKLNRPFIEGRVGQAERMSVLDHFKRHPEVNTIFITKVGDTSIDLPEATVIIQISSHFGSRRQEAQRLGRILRPKGKGASNSKAYFYSLISSDTKEMYYCSKRQQFLLDQGYAYKVISANAILEQWERMVRRKTGEVKKKLGTLEEQKKLLDSVLALTSETLKEDEAKREAAERSAREALRQRRAAAMNMHPILRNMFRKR